MKVMELAAGRELNKVVAEKVLGKRVEKRRGDLIGKMTDGREVHGEDYYIDLDDTTMYLHVTDGYTGMIPLYSRRIDDAWEVVKHFEGYSMQLDNGHSTNGEDSWSFLIWKDGTVYIGSAEEPALAICRASLKAVGADELDI